MLRRVSDSTSPNGNINNRNGRSTTPLNLSLDSDDNNSYLSVLQSASEECVRGLGCLQKVAPALSLSSVFAQDVHTLLYTVGNVEVALHQFVDRELLPQGGLGVRRREQGARLQDALGRANNLKSTVQGSLLAGGIASLLHLFSQTLRRMNEQLEELMEIEEAGDAYGELATSVVCGLLLRRASARRSSRARGVATVLGAGAAVRFLLLRLQRRRAAAALGRSQARLSLVLQLWWLATSVLQRATKHNSQQRNLSYIELDRLARQHTSGSGGGGPSYGGGEGGGLSAGLRRNSSGNEAPGGSSGFAEARSNVSSIDSTGSGVAGVLLAASLEDEFDPRADRRRSGGGGDGGMYIQMNSLPPSRSYPQLIAAPGLHDVDDNHKNALRQLFDACVPWSAMGCPHAFWWEDSHPIIALTQRGINAFYAAMFAARRALTANRLSFAGGEYALAAFLLPWFLCLPNRAAAEVYASWNPVESIDVRAMQIVYAPLRWPASVQITRSIFGNDLHHAEHRICGMRIVVISEDPIITPAAASYSPGGHSPGGRGREPPGTPRSAGWPTAGSGPGSEVLARPTVLFIPGGAFIADFEAVDMVFLYKWVREAHATIIYVTYDFAPQAPFPTALKQVAAIYRALRQGTYDHALGFRASPIVISGLSAGGNLAASAMLSILSPQLLDRNAALSSPEGMRTRPSFERGSSSRLDHGSQAIGPDEETCPMPDAMLLICPVLNLNRSPSPSRVAFCSDTLLPQPLLTAFAKAYDGNSADELNMWADPLLSPALAPDDVIRRLPLTHIQVGGFDPLLDDSVDFNTRIRRLGVPGELRIHRTLPHTFFSFPTWHTIPEVQQALSQSIQWLEDALWRARPGFSAAGPP